MGGEEEAAGLRVHEARQRLVRQGQGEGGVLVAPAGLQQNRQGVEEVGVVVQIAGMLGLAVPPGGEQDAVPPKLGANEVQSRGGRRKPSRLLQNHGRLRQALDGQGVPGGQHLVVQTGAFALLPLLEQLLLGAGQQGVRPFRLQGQALHHGAPGVAAVQVPLILEVGRLVDAVERFRHQVLVGAEQALDALPAPEVELALLPFGVRVQRGEEAAVGMAHLPQQPAGGFPDRAGEQSVGADGQGVRVQGEKLPVVVEHLLEVGNHPGPVRGVAAEAAAQMVVDAASGHLGEGGHHHVQRLSVALAVAVAVCPVAQHPLQGDGHRKLGRPAETAVLFVVLRLQLLEGGGKQLGVAQGGAVRRRFGIEPPHQADELLVLLVQGVAVLREGLVDAQHQVDEAGQLVARRLREVGAGEKGR